MYALVEMDDLTWLYFRSFALYCIIGCLWQQHAFVIERDRASPTGIGIHGHDATNRRASQRQHLPHDGGWPERFPCRITAEVEKIPFVTAASDSTPPFPASQLT